MANGARSAGWAAASGQGNLAGRGTGRPRPRAGGALRIPRSAQPCLTVAEGMGFAVDEAEVVFWGAWPACKAAESSADTAQPRDTAQPNEEVRQ